RDRLLAGLQAEMADRLIVHGNLAPRLPNTLAVSFPGVSGQELLSHIPELCASTGAAHQSDTPAVSSTLAAMGVPSDGARGSSWLHSQERKRDVAWLSEVQQPMGKLRTETPQISELLVDENGKRILAVTEWTRRRETLRKWWLDFIGPLPTKRTAPPKLEIVQEDRDAGVVRQLVRYDVEPGIATEAYLLKPIDVKTKSPGLVVFHSTIPYSIRQPAGLEG